MKTFKPAIPTRIERAPRGWSFHGTELRHDELGAEFRPDDDAGAVEHAEDVPFHGAVDETPRGRWVQCDGPNGATSVYLIPAWLERAVRDGRAALEAKGARCLTNAVRSAAESLCLAFDPGAGTFSQQVRTLAYQTLVEMARAETATA